MKSCEPDHKIVIDVIELVVDNGQWIGDYMRAVNHDRYGDNDEIKC